MNDIDYLARFPKHGKGFTNSNLYNFISFYKTYPEIFQSLVGKSSDILTWTHYLALMRAFDAGARFEGSDRGRAQGRNRVSESDIFTSASHRKRR